MPYRLRRAQQGESADMFREASRIETDLSVWSTMCASRPM